MFHAWSKFKAIVVLAEIEDFWIVNFLDTNSSTMPPSIFPGPIRDIVYGLIMSNPVYITFPPVFYVAINLLFDFLDYAYLTMIWFAAEYSIYIRLYPFVSLTLSQFIYKLHPIPMYDCMVKSPLVDGVKSCLQQMVFEQYSSIIQCLLHSQLMLKTYLKVKS